MNKRIEEIKQASMITVRGHGAFGESERYVELDIDKFAELIIQECISVMSETAKYHDERGTYMGDDVPTATHQRAIKKHFGVGADD